jgi:hypothetical protein
MKKVREFNLFKLSESWVWNEVHSTTNINERSAPYALELAELIQERILKENKILDFDGISFVKEEWINSTKKVCIDKQTLNFKPTDFFSKIQDQFFLQNSFNEVQPPPNKLPKLQDINVKFTKDRWVVLPPSAGIDANWHVTDTSDTFVAHVYGFDHSVDEQSFYNAHLIAQAPKLFEFICQFIYASNDFNNVSKEEKSSLLFKAMALRNEVNNPSIKINDFMNEIEIKRIKKSRDAMMILNEKLRQY